MRALYIVLMQTEYKQFGHFKKNSPRHYRRGVFFVVLLNSNIRMESVV